MVLGDCFRVVGHSEVSSCGTIHLDVKSVNRGCGIAILGAVRHLSPALSARANGGTRVLRCFLSVPFCDPDSFSCVITGEGSEVQIMLKCLLVFFSGAVTVTGFVVATGARTGGLVVLGFVMATIFYVLLAFVVGRSRLLRFFSWISGKRQRQRPRRPPCDAYRG